MAFTRPTLAALVDRVQQDLASSLELETPILRRSVVYVLARVIAGAVHLLYGFLEYISKQMFPDQSDERFLIRQAAIFGLARVAAGYAERDVTFAGTTGAVVPAGTALLRSDGTEYRTTADATLSGGAATGHVRAVLAGADGTLTTGATLSFESPVAGVQSSAVVASTNNIDGSDEEALSALATRLIARMQEPPHGGNAADYVAWAKEVAGVTRAWCFPLEGGAGTVTVRFVRDNDASLIPDSAEVTAVANHIATKSPVTAAVTVAAPTALPVNFTLHIVPDTSATRAAVQAELEDLILRTAAPGGAILLAAIEDAVFDAEGIVNRTVTVPAADVLPSTGQIATMGTITWV